ncbi:MAG: hypothetical protein BMS9Abin37_3051 [Acidobacteriota bacterium]|nr:MAG: hypothetical protein BMS9Abin37_3051 [Acidobacteriota bacterium]
MTKRAQEQEQEIEATGELYLGMSSDQLILRDYLAAGRTDLANERTFLAYIRTALAVFAAGVTFVHFFDSIWLEILGWAIVPIGVAILVTGVVRYERMKKLIRWMQARGGELARARDDLSRDIEGQVKKR